MAKNSAAFAAKDRVDHAVFGSGTISEANERYTTILFDEGGVRKFMTSVVKLERSDTPAPAKTPRTRKKVRPAK